MAINRVVIGGNLTRDGELRATRKGTQVLGFRMAINEKSPDGNGGWVDAPVFINCAVFGQRAEKLAPYLIKGTKVTVDGKLRYSEYMKDDEKRSEVSVMVDRLEFSGSRPAKGDGTAPQEPDPAPAPDLYDEDIPF